MITLYKPNAQNKGNLLSINFSAKTNKTTPEGRVEQRGDKSVYLSFVSQSSWDEKTKTGGFKEGKKCNVKLSPTEAAGIIYAIEKNTTLAAGMGQKYVYHDGETTATTVVFEPYFKKEKQGDKWVTTGEQKGFLFKVTKTEKSNKDNNQSWAVGITFAEAWLVKTYLDDALVHIYTALFSEDVGKRKSVKQENAQTVSETETTSVVTATSTPDNNAELEENPF